MTIQESIFGCVIVFLLRLFNFSVQGVRWRRRRRPTRSRCRPSGCATCATWACAPATCWPWWSTRAPSRSSWAGSRRRTRRSWPRRAPTPSSTCGSSSAPAEKPSTVSAVQSQCPWCCSRVVRGRKQVTSPGPSSSSPVLAGQVPD